MARDPVIQRQVADFIAAYRARSVVVTEGIIGCPHEEGIDFPSGQECPYCPFWRGKQPDVKGSVFRAQGHRIRDGADKKRDSEV